MLVKQCDADTSATRLQSINNRQNFIDALRMGSGFISNPYTNNKSND